MPTEAQKSYTGTGHVSWGLAAVVIAGLCAIVWFSRIQAIDAAYRQTSDIANLGAAILDRAVREGTDNAAAVSRIISEDFESFNPGKFDSLAAEIVRDPLVQDAIIVDRNGEPLESFATPGAPLRIKPLRTALLDFMGSGRKSGFVSFDNSSGAPPTILVANAVQDSNGVALGCVLISIDPRIALAALDEIKSSNIRGGPNSNISLIEEINENLGVVLARFPYMADLVGTNIPLTNRGTRMFGSAHLPRAPTSGLDLYMSWRALPNTPFIVSVSYESAAVLRAWHYSLYVYGALALLTISTAALVPRFAEATKRAELATRLRSIIESSPVPCALNDDAGNITFLNRSFVQTFGYTRDDIPTLEDWWVKAYPATEYRSWVARDWSARLERARKTDQPFEAVELEIRCKNGAIRHVIVRASEIEKRSGTEHMVTLQDITERIANEQKIRQSQQLSQATLDAMASHICVIDEQGSILAVNRSWQEFGAQNGLSHFIWNGINYLEVLQRSVGMGAEEAHLDAAKIQEVIEGRTRLYERAYLCPSKGKNLWFQMSVSRFEIDGAVRAIVRHFDITDRKLAEDQRSAALASLQSTIEASPIPIIGGNLKLNRVTFLNAAFIDTLGYRIEDISTLDQWRSLAFPDPDYRAWVISEIENRLKASPGARIVLQPFEVKIRTKADGVIIGLVNAAAIGGPEASDYIVALQDITPLRQSATAAAHLAAIVDNSDVAIISKSLDGKITSWNKAAEQIFGYSPQEIIGESIRRIIPPAFLAEEEMILSKLRLGERIDHLETERLRKDGQRIHVSLSVSPVRDSNRKIIGAAKILRDISHEKAAEERLRQAQKLEAVGQLTAGVAHDFNNLLAVVLGNLELIADDEKLAPASMKRLESALLATERGGALTQQLLAFARQQTLTPELLDLGAELKSIRRLLAHSIPAGMALEILVDPRPAMVRIDRSQLGNALINLVVNARDAMKAGGTCLISASIEQRATAEVDGEIFLAGRYGVITIQDTGCGMSQDVLAQAFDPFFTTKSVGQGSGLGLSMVYGFMRQSGGRVQLSSLVGKGTTVKLLFPLAGEAASAATETLTDNHVGSPPKHFRALVVDDLKDVRDAVSEQMMSLGFEVMTATDGPSAIGLLESDSMFDLLVTDIGLTVAMNGIELARTVSVMCPDIKILTMTGYNDLQMTGAQGPGSEWKSLRKPFNRATLAGAINGMFDGSPPSLEIQCEEVC